MKGRAMICFLFLLTSIKSVKRWRNSISFLDCSIFCRSLVTLVKKEMELRHNEFADRVRMDIKTGEEELDLKRECFNQSYGHLFSPRNK